MTQIEMEFYETVIRYLPRIVKALEKIANSAETEDVSNS